MPRKHNFQINPQGVPVIVTPAVEATTTEVPIKRLDRAIEKNSRELTRAQDALVKAQAEVDELLTTSTELATLRSNATADPE